MSILRVRIKQLASIAVILTILFVMGGCGGGGGGGSGPPPSKTGTVSGKVVSATTGTAVPDANIRTDSTTVTSASDGAYSLKTEVGERIVIHADAVGFAETFQVTRVAPGQTTSLDIQLIPSGVIGPVIIATGDTVTVPNSSAQVSIPAGGLVPVSGGAPATIVNVTITPINPSIDPSAMPGDYRAILAGGGPPVPIESFGAILVDIRDDSGIQYTLATGQTATIRIPLGTLSSSPPPNIPLFYFDETTGLWMEEGSATLAGLAPEQYYEGTVTHFGYWNADRAIDTVFVSGCVRDAEDQAMAGLIVKSNGVDYSSAASTLTDQAGNFRVTVRRESLATISAFDQNGNSLDTPVALGPLTADFTLPSCFVTEAPPLAITTQSLPSGVVNGSYNTSLSASSGTEPYSWQLFESLLPTGLTLDSASAQITGSPTVTGTFAITIQVLDSTTPAQSATASFSITIIPEPPSGGDGTLSVTNAPADVGGSFVPNSIDVFPAGTGTTIIRWYEGFTGFNYDEELTVRYDSTNNTVLSIVFIRDSSPVSIKSWWCGAGAGFPACNGINLNRSGGTLSLEDTTFSETPTAPPIIFNGTLNFPAF